MMANNVLRSVVGKLAVTILGLVCFVLFILSILLLQFFENFHITKAEENLMQVATKISLLLEQQENETFSEEFVELIKDQTSRVAIVHADQQIWVSDSADENLTAMEPSWLDEMPELQRVINGNVEVQEEIILPDTDFEAIIVGKPTRNGAIFVYQSLNVVNETKAKQGKLFILVLLSP